MCVMVSKGELIAVDERGEHVWQVRVCVGGWVCIRACVLVCACACVVVLNSKGKLSAVDERGVRVCVRVGGCGCG